MAEGTLESIAISVARLFQPLEEELSTGRIRVLFAELGMDFPPELETQTAFINALQGAVTNTSQLPELIADLVKAIEDDDVSKIIDKAKDLFNVIKSLVENIKNLSTELKGLAGALPGISTPDLNAFADDLPRNLIDYLIVRTLEGTPGMVEALQFIDVIEKETITDGSFTYTTRKIKFDQFTNFIKSPADHLSTLYDWGKPGFDGTKLLPKVEGLLSNSGVPAIYDPGPSVLDLMFLEISPKTDINPKGLLFTLLENITVESDEFVMDDWKIKLTLDTQLGSGIQIITQPNGDIKFIPPSGDLEGDATLEWIAGNQNGDPYLILGEADGSRLEAKELAVKVGAGFAWNTSSKEASGVFTIGGEVKDGKLAIDFSQGDGFLSKILSGVKLESDFDIGFGFSTDEGIYFVGSSTLEIQLPVHIDLGAVDIDGLTFSIGISGNEFPIGISADVKANLGPLKAVVENIGVQADLSIPDSGTDGNLGPVNLDIGFKPPNGVGLSIDAGVVKGGGYLFLDFDRGEYAGALELVFSEWISLKAIGLINTKMPDGSKGFSMIIVITAEFGTGIQLGFGFTLLGVGGILGLNRSVNVEPLRVGVRTGAVESVMFPQDVVANAPRIISDLRAFFPILQDGFLVGPMAKIGYGTPTLVSVSIGVIVEFPDVAITILGVVKVVLPHEQAAVLKLQVNFIGRIEPANSQLWFYAELFDSRILFITLEGGMGLLVNWGDNANFVFSIGGFHPKYSPPPLPFDEPPRLAVNILNESVAKIRIEGYFAVTSNTVQFGARAELFFGFSALKVEGHLGFDVLIQFNPFYFIFEFSAGLSVKVFGFGLFSISISGLLEGPSKWHIKGKAKWKITWFGPTVKINIDQTWGEEKQTELPPIEIFPLIEREFEAITNWEAVLPAGKSIAVSLRKLDESEPGSSEEAEEDTNTLVLHPVGKLRISQRKMPLKLTLEKLGNQKPSDVNRLSVSASIEGGADLVAKDIEEKFAEGEFKNLDKAKRLSSPGFEDYKAGVELTNEGEETKTSIGVKRVIRYETVIIDNNYKRHLIRFFEIASRAFTGLLGRLFRHFLRGNTITQSTRSAAYRTRIQPNQQFIHIQPNLYTVANRQDNRPVGAETMSFTSRASALDYLETQRTSNPEVAKGMHVIPNTEVNTAA